MALAWVRCGGAATAGDSSSPLPRSGHTFTTLAGGDVHVLFGGTGLGADGKAAALGDAHTCRVAADGSVSWQALSVQGPSPAPRARHTAVALDSRRLLVWGGIERKCRFNDCWVLDVAAQRWTAAEVRGTPPQPRAHHTGEYRPA
jgi:dynein heavy chain